MCVDHTHPCVGVRFVENCVFSSTAAVSHIGSVLTDDVNLGWNDLARDVLGLISSSSILALG